jgi:sigma-B regulation protein RsbU (phosphoserine phosphatase)
LPVPPSEYNHEIPPVLDHIIRKLLENEPENRYQSVTGLLSDLERFFTGDGNFEVGLRDHPLKLSYLAPLTGLDDESARLGNMLHQALDGNGSICLITGEAGIGKTMFVEAFRKSAMGLNCIVIDAGAKQQEVKTPWHLFKACLSHYLKIFEGYDTRKKKYISRALKHRK